MGIVEKYLLKLNRKKQRFRRNVVFLVTLSLLVVFAVFWNLHQTGIAIANDASCGLEEHQHTEECPTETVTLCGFSVEADTEEAAAEPTEAPAGHTHSDECYALAFLCGFEAHIHDFSCYTDLTADLESWDIWASSIPELTGQISEDIVLVAQSQLGQRESTLNFALAEDGQTRNGITRYGQWYGNPYGAWSNMFTGFCLRYAGLADVPIHSGADAMRLGWEEANLYRHAGGYEPVSGDIVFLDKNQNGTVESTAVVVRYFDFVLTVMEGDVDNAVVRQEYRIDDPVIAGYGITNPRGGLMFAATAAATPTTVGQTADYTANLLKNGGSFMIYSNIGGNYYALDGNGNAVQIQLSSTGTITADISDPMLLYWEFETAANYDNKPAYNIRNSATGRYLHPNFDDNTANPLHRDKWETALYTSGTGVKLRGARQTAYLQLTESGYTVSQSQTGGSVMYFGKAPTSVTLWLDGTNGNIMSYRGSDNTKYTVYSGVDLQLPSQWKSPTKYSYTLAGWVNIKNGDYYQPGDRIAVTENTVLYADWVATTYDIGQYNSYVADTVSTNDFITTHVFDYSSLINLLSTKATINVSNSSHSETWSHVGSGNVSYKDQPTLNFSFNDHDSSGTITNLNNLNNANKYTGGNGIYAGIYNDALGEVLFGTDNLFDPETGEGVIGKHYLGQGDHLFQINTDPTSEYYGYYYYDAKRNAASYNQSDQRFYVYDYLARTSDSAGNNDAGKYSDFLPLNSPYANTNGQTIKTYNYAGDSGEFSGVSHYEYDARYDASGSAANHIKANLWFGMRVDVQFGLPDTPGVRTSTGEYGNKDIYGNDMHFKFTGDDDVWILVDGNVVLDLGGIHQAAEGDINFSTGEVRVNGKSAGNLSGIQPGEHTLSILYLERGSSMSNCAIYFNLAPRFSLTLGKEDVLTQQVLNGAQFAFYHDQACTQPCDLWPSQQSYKNGDAPTNLFTIENGQAYIWGLSPSRTYYFREVAPPDATGYEPARGVIRLTLDKNGLNSYSATILESIDENGNKIPISHGFTVHGFRIDEENQAAYIVITNAQNWVTENTSVYVEKKWDDTADHTYDAVTVYLNVTDADGTVRRIRQIQLGQENDWKYSWVNLPKYNYDPETGRENKDDPVRYSVSEAYVPGYTHQITVLKNGTYTQVEWASSDQFVNGGKYILMTNGKYIATVAANNGALRLVEEAEAKTSPLALWTATVSSGYVKLTNQAGQSLSYYASGATRYFTTVTNTTANQNLTQTKHNGGVRLAYKSGRSTYYISAFNSNNGYFEAKSGTSSALTIQPLQHREITTTVNLDGLGYSITNTPLARETSLKVTKLWDHPTVDASYFEKEQVTIRLYANGVDTGRTETVSLKSNWTAVFSGLPYMDDEGNPIVYTVQETWDTIDWIPTYGPVISTGGETPTYETTITNTYRWSGSFELPSTGGNGHFIFILSGLLLISAPLVYGLSLRRRYRREAGK